MFCKLSIVPFVVLLAVGGLTMPGCSKQSDWCCRSAFRGSLGSGSRSYDVDLRFTLIMR